MGKATESLKCGGMKKYRFGGKLKYQEGGFIDFSTHNFNRHFENKFNTDPWGYPAGAVIKAGNYKYWPDEYDMYNADRPQQNTDVFIGKALGTNFYGRKNPEGRPDVRSRIRQLMDNAYGIRADRLDAEFSRTELQKIFDTEDSDRLNDFIRYHHPEKIESKKAERFQGGGATGYNELALEKIKSLETSPLDTSHLVSNIDQDLRPMPEGPSLKSGLSEGTVNQIVGAGADVVANVMESGIESFKDKVARDYDPREDPAEALLKTDRADIAKNVVGSTAKGAAKGASIGSLVPGVGTVAGAIVGGAAGLLKSGAEAIFGGRERKAKREDATSDYKGYWAERYFANRNMAEGGMIKGKGGPKSDSITMKARRRSFVVPAENAEEGMRLGKEFLGWTDDNIAKRNNQGSTIKVSDGEVFYTPEEVDRLEMLGIDLNKLAPNAKPGNRMANGTHFLEREQPMVAAVDEATKPQLSLEEFENALLKTIASGAVKPEELMGKKLQFSDDIKSTPEDAEKDRVKLAEFIPEIAASAQILGALDGLRDAGKRPDLTISSRLKALADDTRQAATYGLEPSVRNAYMREIERTRRDVMNKIVARGGSPGEVNAALEGVTSQTLAQKAQIPIMEQDMMLKKKALNVEVEKVLADMVYDRSKVNREDWYRHQEAWGAMLTAGLENLIGSRQYKENLDYLKSVGSSAPTFTITTNPQT